jgi:hypothetical protein
MRVPIFNDPHDPHSVIALVTFPIIAADHRTSAHQLSCRQLNAAVLHAVGAIEEFLNKIVRGSTALQYVGHERFLVKTAEIYYREFMAKNGIANVVRSYQGIVPTPAIIDQTTGEFLEKAANEFPWATTDMPRWIANGTEFGKVIASHKLYLQTYDASVIHVPAAEYLKRTKGSPKQVTVIEYKG